MLEWLFGKKTDEQAPSIPAIPVQTLEQWIIQENDKAKVEAEAKLSARKEFYETNIKPEWEAKNQTLIEQARTGELPISVVKYPNGDFLKAYDLEIPVAFIESIEVEVPKKHSMGYSSSVEYPYLTLQEPWMQSCGSIDMVTLLPDYLRREYEADQFTYNRMMRSYYTGDGSGHIYMATLVITMSSGRVLKTDVNPHAMEQIKALAHQCWKGLDSKREIS